VPAILSDAIGRGLSPTRLDGASAVAAPTH
jgi:hypothetical protein